MDLGDSFFDAVTGASRGSSFYLVTKLLKKAFDRASRLPDDEQDEIGQWLLDALENDEKLWSAAFAKSPDKLKRLADEALEAFRSDRTEPLDPEKL